MTTQTQGGAGGLALDKTIGRLLGWKLMPSEGRSVLARHPQTDEVHKLPTWCANANMALSLIEEVPCRLWNTRHAVDRFEWHVTLYQDAGPKIERRHESLPVAICLAWLALQGVEVQST